MQISNHGLAAEQSCDLTTVSEKILKPFINVSRFGVTSEHSIARQQLVHPAVRYGF